MREYLQWFFEAFEYPGECSETMMAAYDALYADAGIAARFDEILSRYEENMECDIGRMIEDVGAVLEDAQVNEYTGKLLMHICMSKTLREYYRREGVNETIWFTSMCDLKYKAVECKLVHGIWGSFVCSWFGRFFKMSRFGFEKLQFELIEFDSEFESDGVKLMPGMPVINIHIPRTGGRLDEESMKKAFDQAAAFFRQRYQLEQVVFHCSSWLLYPKNLEILSENSNLRRFIDTFDLYADGVYDNYDALWRLFDKKYEGDIDALPQNTSFRRGYADWVRKGIPTGWGCGVYVYQK